MITVPFEDLDCRDSLACFFDCGKQLRIKIRIKRWDIVVSFQFNLIFFGLERLLR